MRSLIITVVAVGLAFAAGFVLSRTLDDEPNKYSPRLTRAEAEATASAYIRQEAERLEDATGEPAFTFRALRQSGECEVEEFNAINRAWIVICTSSGLSVTLRVFDDREEVELVGF